jgi:16S rRNA (cytidine1402-2'-O)-methyltransferase
MSGQLILVPTPISDEWPLETTALELIKKDCLDQEVIICVEEHKVARGRWLKWGLPRECIERFVLFNEHTQDKIQPQLLRELKLGKRIFLLSDCGLPAFCDPGQKLVDACHRHHIKVSSTPFPNSVALALALSGFSHQSFIFCGFAPLKDPERGEWLKKYLRSPETLILMDTPYRLHRLLKELEGLNCVREIFLGLDLNSSQELLLRSKVGELLKKITAADKREFVMVVGSQAG